MATPRSVLLPCLALPLLAQAPLPTTIGAVDVPSAISRSAGLEADAAGSCRGGGAAYRAAFDRRGMRFEPALGRGEPQTRHLALQPTELRRGARTVVALTGTTAPVATGDVVDYEHAPGLHERLAVGAQGVELSWSLAAPLPGSGDLIVRYAVDTSLAAPVAERGGLYFRGERGGVHIGGVTGIDADGRQVAGDLQWVGGGLELSLPHEFVATASYPLVLDPLIGTTLPISSGLTYADGVPDAAYDATTNRFLVVWERAFSASNVDIRGQLLTSGGTLVGSTIFFGSAGVATGPRVANLGVRDRFGVSWTQTEGTTHTVRLQTCEAGSGALAFMVIVASSTTNPFPSADVGSQCEAPIGSSRGFVVAYEDDDLGDIRARRVWFNANDSILSGSSFTVYSDTAIGANYFAPALSRTAAADGKLLLVARRRSNLLVGSAIVAVQLDAGSNTLGSSQTVASSTADELFAPDVDGQAGKWVVAWERAGGGLLTEAVRVAAVAYDEVTAAWTLGTAVTFGGTPFSRASAPTLGYTSGRTWLGYRLQSSLSTPAVTLRVAAIDSGSCTSCNDTFTVPDPDGDRIVVATMASGGRTDGEDCLCVYHDSFDDVFAQRLRNYGTGGSIADLGGACGASGTQAFSHSPGIGSSGLRNTLSGVPASTLAAIFNFSEPSTTSVCGACVWTPFSVTLTPPVVGGTASVEFGIPCLPSLVGAQFETQWTTIDFTQAPCPFFPGLTNTNRLLMTVGQ